MSSQTFYPRQSNVGMWCAMFLVFRVVLERKRALALSRRAGVARAAAPSAGTPAVLEPDWAAQPAAAPVAARRAQPLTMRPARGGRVSLDSLLWARSA
jgi:hypothetical protein